MHTYTAPESLEKIELRILNGIRVANQAGIHVTRIYLRGDEVVILTASKHWDGLRNSFLCPYGRIEIEPNLEEIR